MTLLQCSFACKSRLNRQESRALRAEGKANVQMSSIQFKLYFLQFKINSNINKIKYIKT